MIHRLFFTTLIALTLIGCSNEREMQAKQLYNLSQEYHENREFDKAIEILRRVSIDYEDTEIALTAENEIEQYQALLTLSMDTQSKNLNQSFERIERALENYKVRFLAYPLTPKDLEKLPAVVVPDWVDVWGNAIYYKPSYTSPDLPRHSPDGYVLASFGKDGLPGGADEDRDHFYKNGEPIAQIIEE